MFQGHSLHARKKEEKRVRFVEMVTVCATEGGTSTRSLIIIPGQ